MLEVARGYRQSDPFFSHWERFAAGGDRRVRPGMRSKPAQARGYALARHAELATQGAQFFLFDGGQSVALAGQLRG